MIAKTDLTKSLERDIYIATKKMGVFTCFEVTIGIGGSERVDYMTYDTKGIWRCYEIKVSKSDFYSKAANSFVGNFNYYVMTRELYEDVKDDIPDYVGVYLGQLCKKKPKKRELCVNEHVLKDSMIRSLARDSEKLRKVSDPTYVERTQTKIKNLQSDLQTCQSRCSELRTEIWLLKRSDESI